MQTHSVKQSRKRALLVGLIFGMLLSFLFTCVLLLFLNDRYAFVKQDGQARITVKENASPAEVASLCKEAGVVRFASPLASYLQAQDAPIEKGVYTLDTDASYREIASVLHRKRANTIQLTFAEGTTVPEIITALCEAGIGTPERYTEVINTYPFDFDWIPRDYPAARAYRLEGYLYPDTYEFYQNASEESVILKFLSNFDRKFDAEYRAECARRQMSIDQAVTLASVIQAEVKYLQEYPLASSVLHNRLASGRRWESDATVRYALRLQGQDRAPTAQDLRNAHPYNTYQNFGYPPSAICNPSREALAYAICPKKTNYYYFVATKNGTTLFARSYAEHLQNVEKASQT